MPKLAVDISFIGDKALAKALREFHPRIQKKVVRQALRKSAKRLKGKIVENLSGDPVSPNTGRWLAAARSVKIQAFKRSRVRVGVGVKMPERDALGIAPDDKYYYPFAVEYGHIRGKGRSAAPAKMPIRRAVDDNTPREHRTLGRDIGKGIEREAKAAFKKAIA